MNFLSPINPTRQESLRLWLTRNGIRQADIAKALDTGANTISRWLRADNIPTWRHQQLVKFGIPVELLPAAVDIPPGPKKSRAFPAPPQVAEMQA